ncbi:YciI family protein [Actinomycetospora straminea]|uniref:YciI family protein n=1 Tax=Actinomycetospora straminea TaxID=663607 RepID=A0ABP9ELP6_9PSEU|nr:YciI family protein [Actinomycetospora straminea]MDD7934362.1 YciI family protein [Actinomycetospora straminea]
MHYLMGVRIDESVLPYPDDELEATFARVGAVNDEMKAAGVWVFGGGLTPSDSATVVRRESGATTVTDGPFAETKEQLGGFYVIEVDDLDQALHWAEKCAEACRVPIEVRPFEGIA